MTTYTPTEMLARLSEKSATELYALCPRKVRNMLEGKYGKKIKSGGRVTLKTNADRTREALTVRDGIVKAADDKMADELLKTYLYSKRPMLKDTLDFLGIPNEDGITEQELDALEKAEPAKLRELFALLKGKGYTLEDIALYFAFTKVEHYADLEELQPIFG